MIFALVILYVVTLVYLSITERYRNYASLIALQGWILFFVALLKLHTIELSEMIFVVAETLIFKAIIVPRMLFRIIKRTKINRIAPFGMTLTSSLLCSLLALVMSVVITYYIADTSVNMIFLCVALYALLSGLLMVVTRRRIFSHLVGFLVVENGVFLFSMAMGVEMPFLINIAILLDILISVLMLGVFMNKLGDKMNVVDTDDLASLKD
ncbi:MAG: hypothetical protein R3Y38_05155 [Rikenellaceae bacterium]